MKIRSSQRLVAAWQGFRAQVSGPARPWRVEQAQAVPAAVQAACALVLGDAGDARVGHMLLLETVD